MKQTSRRFGFNGQFIQTCGIGHLLLPFLFFLFMLRQIGLQSFRQFTAGQHYAVLTASAFQTDIRPKAHHCPFIGTAWVRLAQSEVIFQLQVR